jgi:hypothetical protein
MARIMAKYKQHTSPTRISLTRLTFSNHNQHRSPHGNPHRSALSLIHVAVHCALGDTHDVRHLRQRQLLQVRRVRHRNVHAGDALHRRVQIVGPGTLTHVFNERPSGLKAAIVTHGDHQANAM